MLAPAFCRELPVLWNFKKDLRKLKSTIETIKAVLVDADKRESDPYLKNYMSVLTVVVYDAEDLLEAVAAMALQKKLMCGNMVKKEVSLFFSKSNQLCFILNTALQIKAIRESLSKIATDMKSHAKSFDYSRPGMLTDNYPVRSETHSFVNEDDVIGRNREREEIIKLLLPNRDGKGDQIHCQQHLSVISIIGFGGLGKTTLAGLVYNDERVKGGFDLHMWACINDFSYVPTVLQTLLESLGCSVELGGVSEMLENEKEIEEMLEKLREIIGGKLFLLALDGVWDGNPGYWHVLEEILHCGKSGSKVLVTTRALSVARCLGAIEPYFQLNVLSEESAWTLFKKVAIREGELDNHSELVPLGREIVRRCGFVPLTLVHIGSILCGKLTDKKTWLSFVDKELPEVLQGDNRYGFMNVMKSSYSKLSPALKHCFSYCSLFPKTYTFDKDEMIHLWLAQGFLQPQDGRRLEEVGDEYFFYLVDNSFFQDVKTYTRNNVLGYKFKLHGLLHDLAIQAAGSDSKCICEDDLKDMNEWSTFRHISVKGNPNLFFDSFDLPSLSRTLRTLLFHDTLQFKVDISKSFIASLSMLRTLKLSHLNINNLPNIFFEELIHLRYLNLSYNWNLETLPNSICKLCYLQTLRLEGCVSLTELPSKFRKLVNLRHLFLENCNSLAYMPSGLEALTSLVTLDRLIVHRRDGGLRYLHNLDNLCGAMTVELPLEGWRNCVLDASLSNMSSKCRLSGLSICWIKSEANGADEIGKDEAREVLNALEPHSSLIYMNIDGYVGDALSSWVFSLPSVRELTLTNCASEYLDDMIRSYTCPHLEILKMNCLTNLKGWWREVQPRDSDQMPELPCFPSVSMVVIQNCPRLVESMPLLVGIKNLHLLGVHVKLVEALLTADRRSSPSSSTASSSDSKLEDLQLYRVDGLSCLPDSWIKHLTALKTFSISGCDQLEWVSRGALAHLTALESLSIFDCGTVKLEDEDSEKAETELGMPWKALERLRDLTIPWQRHLQEGLRYLTAAERLEISYSDITQVETDNREIEGRGMWWKGLAKLGQLKVRFGDEMTACFPKWIHYLRFLEDVEFYNCKELSLSWTTLLINMKLRKLSFMKVEKVTTVEEEEEVVNPHIPLRLSSLEELYVSTTNEEEWVQSIPCKLFPSLRTLTLYDVPNLKSLPSGIQHLTSLQQLIIGDCSTKLKNRCTRNGADWPLISHIQDVDIRSSSCD